jgi:hypothetical protein
MFMTASSSTQDLIGFRNVQRLAYESVVNVGKLLTEGWTEKQAARLIETYLRDYGVKAFFHKPFVWFGERTRFDGIQRRRYWQFNPTHRHLNENDVIILDTAPILDGYIGDIGYTLSLQPLPQLETALSHLRMLRKKIPHWADEWCHSSKKLWDKVDQEIHDAGYDNIHKIYPFEVLAHRVHRVPLSQWGFSTPLRFSLHSFWSILSRGLYGELLNLENKKPLQGLWAIEPHIGGKGFGAKFEEILVIDNQGSHWLDEKVPHVETKK